jgi:hypothetical protein
MSPFCMPVSETGFRNDLSDPGNGVPKAMGFMGNTHLDE